MDSNAVAEIIPVIFLVFVGILIGAVITIPLMKDKKAIQEEADERWAYICNIVEMRYKDGFRSSPDSESGYEEPTRDVDEDAIAEKVLKQIRPKLNEVEINTRYSSDHPTNIWGKYWNK